ncbi:MAG TPA: acyl-ACP thioesterase domain-containing protein [Bacteroidales bacterium]|nr:acyl-ACP thioesterase domain-containing protein [Bacteroidales bacterium]
MELLQFEKEYRVHVYETGPDGKLNLYSLFNYMQDIASDHAVKLGFGRDDLMRDNRFWVLARLYAEIYEWPSWEDSIIVKTWPNGTDKLFALRNYEVHYPDGRLIASATSSWLILNRTTKKVQRPDSILNTYNPNLHSNKSPIRYALKLEPSAENGHISPRYKINVSDLDVNLHSNNVRYLKWVCDTYDLDFVMKNIPQSAEINYLAESLFNEEILIRTSVENGNGSFYNHSVKRPADDKELCRIRISWKEGKTK